MLCVTKMAAEKSSLADKWKALVQLAKVHEAKLHEYIHIGRAKGETNYNIQVVGKTDSECRDILKGVEIYSEILEKITEIVWGEARGLKISCAAPEDHQLWGDAGTHSSEEALRQVAWEQFYPEIRQQVVAELNASGGPPDESQMAAKLLGELKRSQQNAEIEEKINLIGRGNQELTVALKTWEKLLKFVENRDTKKLDALAQDMASKMREFIRILIKLEE